MSQEHDHSAIVADVEALVARRGSIACMPGYATIGLLASMAIGVRPEHNGSEGPHQKSRSKSHQ